MLTRLALTAAATIVNGAIIFGATSEPCHAVEPKDYAAAVAKMHFPAQDIPSLPDDGLIAEITSLAKRATIECATRIVEKEKYEKDHISPEPHIFTGKKFYVLVLDYCPEKNGSAGFAVHHLPVTPYWREIAFFD